MIFGEYTIINGSRALAMPFDRYFGAWTPSPAPDPRLLDFADYLDSLQVDTPFLDVGGFRRDAGAGLIFRSNIPTGYGLGSSGALCAAVYDRYALAPIGQHDTGRFEQLKTLLAKMESHFHGSSSGTDPLICYLSYPVLIQPDGFIAEVKLPDDTDRTLTFFLLDTQLARSTGPLVKTREDVHR